MSLIDNVLPRFDFREVHRRHVRAGCAEAAQALPRVDLARSPYVGPLFALRSLPGRLAGHDTSALRAGCLGDFFARAFTTLVDAGPRGLVVGAVGEFWRTSGAMRPIVPATFGANAEAGCARLAWAFEFEPAAHGGCMVTTETRIACNDERALARMRAYWLLIRLPSGLIRREILRLLAREAERTP